MTRHLLFTIILAAVLPLSVMGQRKEMAQAKQWLKAGNNLEKAETQMKKLLADSANRRNEKIWELYYESVRKQYEQGNAKIYLRQKYDTAQLFTAARKMFLIQESFDSIDALPDEKGKVKLKYRKRNAAELAPLRVNLFSGGGYFLQKTKYQEAFDMYSTYVDCARQPLFSAYNYATQDPRLPEAGYWTLFCAYKLNQLDAALRYRDLALQDTAHYAFTLQYLAEIYQQKRNVEAYLKVLNEGFRHYPAFPYFFPRLAEYYMSNHQYAEASRLVDEALKRDPDNLLYRFTRSTVLLNTGKYEECVKLCDEIIATNDTLAEAYQNAGLAFFNTALYISQKGKGGKADRKAELENYRRALPYLERFRALAPKQQEKWALPLYTIYLNLNMGKKFDEVNAILENMKTENKK